MTDFDTSTDGGADKTLKHRDLSIRTATNAPVTKDHLHPADYGRSGAFDKAGTPQSTNEVPYGGRMG